MIPLATTTITVQRTDDTGVDPYDPPDPTTFTTDIATNIRATIGAPTATVNLNGGNRVTYQAQLRSDVCDIEPGDTIIDSAGTRWTVLWATHVTALGQDMMQGVVRLVEGAT